MLLLLGFYLVVLVAYSATVPVFEAPDEPLHLRYVNFIAKNHRLPDLNTADRNEVPSEGHQPPLFYVIAAALVNLVGRDSVYPELQPNPNFNKPDANIVMHPPSELTDADTGAVHLLRLISVISGIATVIFTYRVATVLGLGESTALVSAIINASVPQFAFMASVLNNHALSWMFASLALGLSLEALVARKVSFSRLVILGSALGLALLTKAITLTLIPVVAGVLLLKTVFFRDWALRQFMLAVAAIAAVALLVGGWWYLKNLILYGDLTGFYMNLELNKTLIDQKSLASPYFGTTFPVLLFLSFWARFGWMNVAPPSYLFAIYAAVSCVSILRLALLAREIVRGNRQFMRMEAGLGVLSFFAIIVFSGVVYLNLVLTQPQGRFMFPAISAISVLMAVGLKRALRAEKRTGRLTVWSVVILMLA